MTRLDPAKEVDLILSKALLSESQLENRTLRELQVDILYKTYLMLSLDYVFSLTSGPNTGNDATRSQIPSRESR